MPCRRILNLLLAVLLSAGSAVFAAYPQKPVRLLVGYAPGGATDIIARMLAQSLTAKWGQSVLVENRPGASGMLAGEIVVRANTDGHTLLLGYTPEVLLNKLVFKKMPYDPSTAMTPIALIASAPLVLVSGPKLGVETMKDLLAKKGAGVPLTYGTPGAGGQQHLASELLGKLTGIPVTHVPYRGTALAVNDLLGGQIDLFFATTPPLLSHIRSGRLRPLLVAGPAREKLLPDVPTAVELGLPRLQITNWFGVFGPRGIPTAVVSRIAEDSIAALSDRAFAKSFEDQGLTATPLQGGAFLKFLDTEMKKFKAIVVETGIGAE